MLPFTTYFTTEGPIKIDTFSIVQPNDSAVAIIDLTLLNLGNENTIPNVTAVLKTNDPCITRIPSSIAYFHAIEPGESKKTNITLGFYKKSCDNPLKFELEIRCDNIVYWTDSLIVDLATDINDQLQILPTEYRLNQNYPNPFNPTTTIKYSIPREGKSQKAKSKSVTLKIFDLLGREITTLVNEKQRPGNYEIIFDGSSVNRRISSGIYFYQLQVYPAERGVYSAIGGADEYVETKKMILLK